MERTEEALRKRVRETPLSERLTTCEKYIASMCAERRPPKMTIPLQHYDEDFYIYTTLADAQATIAALQARVQELEQWVQDQSTANLETMRHTDEMQSRAMEAEQQLTQRTAELEAAKRERDVWYARYNELSGVKDRQLNDLQAELERVRGELADERTAYKALSEQYNRLDLEHSDLRTLLLALPKVEGEIRVEEGKVISVEPVRGADPPLWWRRTIATFEDGLLAKHYSKLLQHRQGMEG